ncbi:transposase (fragment) [Moritella yayanosii]|uniref:Transposase n=2 Tax=Moritella yayanosii TaxID=69539 RepID=A0A330LRE5_9GAMM
MPYKDAVLTITADNDKEFAYHEQVTQALNENTNGLLRQYWPKKTDFKLISTNEVDEVIVQLNNRPRKKLNYQTPSKLMKIHMAAIAA